MAFNKTAQFGNPANQVSFIGQYTIVINGAATTTTAANATASASASSQTVSLSATVTSSAGTVNAGTVTFTVMQGSTTIGSAVTSGTVSNGSASANYTLPANTPGGTYTINASYSGGGNFAASSDTTHTLTVTGSVADFSLSAAPGSLTIVQGNNRTSTITVNPLNGFTGPVALSASGLPTGVAATFMPASTSTSSQLTLTAAPTASLGSATVTITGMSGNLSHTTPISLTVNAAPAAKLVFTTSPNNSTAGTAFTTQPVVAIEDANGNVVATDNTDQVTPAITNGTGTAGATLTCAANPLTVSSGMAQFAGCEVNQAGNNYTLTATSGALTPATGNPFNVTAKAGFAQSAILTPGDIVSIDDAGDTIVAADGMEAFVFFFSGGAWHEVAQLNDPDANTNLTLGAASTAISSDGNTIVVGSCNDAVCKGHAFVFVAPPGGWSTLVNANNTVQQTEPTAALSASDASATGGDRIGFSVAVATGMPDVRGNPVNVVAVSAPQDVTQGAGVGHVYVYVEPATGWGPSNPQNPTQLTQTAEISSPAAAIGNNPPQVKENFGFSVSIDKAGATIAVGAASTMTTDVGEGFIFLEPIAGWGDTSTPDATLTPSDGVGGGFGQSIAISGDGNTVVAGAPYHGAVGINAGPGAAYVFQKPGATWSTPNAVQERAQLTAADGNNGDSFGGRFNGNYVSIADDGSTIAVEAPQHGTGTAYVFPRPGANWSNPAPASQELPASAGMDIHGNAVTPANTLGTKTIGISGNGSVIAMGGTVTGAPGIGGVFVF